MWWQSYGSMKNLASRIHVLWVISSVLGFFISSIKCWRSFNCTEHLNPGSQKSHFWKLKIRHYNCGGIKFICSKYYLQILEEIHKKLSDLHQLKDELENNVWKWYWAGHVQKTIRILLHPKFFIFVKSAIRNALYLWLISGIVVMGSDYATAWGVFNTIRWGHYGPSSGFGRIFASFHWTCMGLMESKSGHWELKSESNQDGLMW